MQTYRSLYPNHTHQLTVSVSKHYWITNEGILKYQHKKMEVSLDKITRSKKNHLIHYIVRDHCSGVVYSEVSTSRKNITLTEFLYRAWNKKNDFAFCGIPELLTIPQIIEKLFPGILESISLLGVQFPKVTSGFQAGVGDVKTLEEYMKFYTEQLFENNHEKLNKTYTFIATMNARTGKQSKIDLWCNHVGSVRVPPASWLENT